MDLLPELDITSYFVDQGRRTILRKLRGHKCATLETLLYMFTRAPPIIYSHFYSLLDLDRNDFNLLKTIAENMEKDVLKIKTPLVKNARILTKLNEAFNEQANFKFQKATSSAKLPKYTIGHRMEVTKRTRACDNISKAQLEVSKETGIPLLTIIFWNSKFNYYKRMSDQYPGILNVHMFGERERAKAEVGRMVLELGIKGSTAIFPSLSYASLARRLIYYIKCAGFIYNDKLEEILEVLRYKAMKDNSVFETIIEFELEYQGWLSAGGAPTIIIPKVENTPGFVNNGETQNSVYSTSNNLQEGYIDLSQLSSDSEEAEDSRWENTIRASQSEKYTTRPKEARIPGIQNIPHRYVRKVLQPSSRHVGKTKYDKIEEKWATVMLNKYLILTPAEIGEILKIGSRVVWSNIELYQEYGPRGLIEDVQRERLVQRYFEEYSGEIREYAESSSRTGGTLSFHNTYNYLKEKRRKTNLSRELIKEVLKKLGYSYCKTKGITYKEKNRPRIISMREEYIRGFFENREKEHLKEIYIDESFVRDIVQSRSFWMTEEEQKQRSVSISSIRNQIAIVGAIGEDGWTGVHYDSLEHDLRQSNHQFTFSAGGIFYFKTLNPDRRDPHTCFTAQSFHDYFLTNLLPSLKESSLLIMDRAPYHTKVAESDFNIRKATKQDLLEFLLEKGVLVDSRGSLQELRYRVLSIFPNPRTYLEIEAEEAGHKVLFTPPYHPELNPIELAWAMVKRPISEKAQPDTNYICEQILPRSFALVTPHVAAKLFSHVEGVLSKFRQEIPIKIEDGPHYMQTKIMFVIYKIS